ncbi:MAG: protein-L-isoaspartate(D-aspartate) O-methyltransferase [Hyphomicrobium sp.]|uniref:protein-L-isoaspartate(D-aspartate) O-methyltransferase n=1 Tax=Hyphomicrobium sp. TaxID=82 RepID=UPI003D096760
MGAIDEEERRLREAMVGEVERMAATLSPSTARRAFSPRVLAALRAVPRHLFVAPEHQADAYVNRPLPIGYGQTISQPFIVALMTDLLDIEPGDRVLEIGTGCGYQTAVLARLAATVFTIELSEPLAQRAGDTLGRLGVANVQSRTGDGNLGWSEAAPFDAILVAAAAPEVPDALVAQLAPGARLVLPVGGSDQQLIVVEKRSDQSTVLREIIPVCFVPLARKKPAPDI